MTDLERENALNAIFTSKPYNEMERAMLNIWSLPKRRYTKKGLGIETNKDFSRIKKKIEYNRLINAICNFLDNKEYEGHTENSYLKLSARKNVIYAIGKYNATTWIQPILLRNNHYDKYRLVDPSSDSDNEILEQESQYNKILNLEF